MNESETLLESEIAQLTKEIEIKRAELEAKSGIVSERGALHEVIAEKLDESSADAASLRQELCQQLTSSTPATANQKAGYLASLSDDQVEAMNQLIAMIPQKGIAKAIADAKKLDPFLLDAFHDCLVDKLYSELAARGLVGPGRASK